MKGLAQSFYPNRLACSILFRLQLFNFINGPCYHIAHNRIQAHPAYGFHKCIPMPDLHSGCSLWEYWDSHESIPFTSKPMISSAVLPRRFLSQRIMISSKYFALISPKAMISSSRLSPVPLITPTLMRIIQLTYKIA
jgi:hypothetical protein